VGIDVGLKEHYQAVKTACEGLAGVDFLGLFSPTNEAWNWVYLFKTESMGKHREISRETEELFGGRPEGFSSTLWRMYEKYDPLNLDQKPSKSEWKPFVFAVLFQNNGVHDDFKEKDEIVTDLFEGRAGVEYLGLYAPRNEGWHGAYFFMADSWQVGDELEAQIVELCRAHPEKFVKIITREYNGMRS
jgi:hypothetical protein